MSQSHRIKGGTTDEEFQEQCFLWKREASVDVDFDLLYGQEHIEEKTKHMTGLL